MGLFLLLPPLCTWSPFSKPGGNKRTSYGATGTPGWADRAKKAPDLSQACRTQATQEGIAEEGHCCEGKPREDGISLPSPWHEALRLWQRPARVPEHPGRNLGLPASPETSPNEKCWIYAVIPQILMSSDAPKRRCAH